MVDDIAFNKLCESWNASIKSIKEAERYIEDEATDARIKLGDKISKILNLIHDNKPIDIENELSEAVLLAWDSSYIIKYNECKLSVDILEWATVDVTEERNFLTELDRNYDTSGVDKNENYKEAVRSLQESVKKLDNKIKEIRNNRHNRISNRITAFVLGSILLWSAAIVNYSRINSLLYLGLIIVLAPVGIYILVMFFKASFLILNNLLLKGNYKNQRKKTNY